MDKENLIKEVASATRLSKSVTKKIVEAFCEIVSETVKSGEEVKIYGFGKFESRKSAARRIRNPRTGEMMQLSEKMTAKFKAGKQFENGAGTQR